MDSRQSIHSAATYQRNKDQIVIHGEPQFCLGPGIDSQGHSQGPEDHEGDDTSVHTPILTLRQVNPRRSRTKIPRS